MSFFQNLNFASSNEDGQTELTVLAESKHIVCLTGSGTRPLDMLLTGADKIYAIDINPMQNALLELKIAAFKTLNYAELLAYLGLGNCSDRMVLHARVEGQLTPELRNYWQQYIKLIRAGIWYAGLWEKVLRMGARGVRLIRGRAVNALFAAATLEEQQDIWQRRFDDRIWRASIRILGRRWVWTRIIGEPGGGFLPPPGEVEARLAGAFSDAAGLFFFRDSDFASLILRGHHVVSEALPLHLQHQNFENIRDSLSRIQIVDGGLTDLSRLGISGVDGFSLSDFGSYCDQAAYTACWQGVLDAAAPKARFCERVFMNPLPHPFPQIHVNERVSKQLTRNDRAIIYNIVAGTIEQ